MALTNSTTSTLTLDESNTCSGTTCVNGGTLLVNGTNTGGDAFTVNVGATRGGTGSISRPVVGHGTLVPGEGVGKLSVLGDVTFSAGSRFTVELDGASPDKLVARGIDNSISAILDASARGALMTTNWLVVEYSGNLSDQFDTVFPG